jgi:tetratricopeptide (TPR) repeat protein
MQPMASFGRSYRLSFFAILLPLIARAADPQAAVVSALAIQDAIRQGRELLQKGEAKAAVEVLEARLAGINGNPAYLGLLREAYSAYVKDLELAHNDDMCAIYQKRLQILDKSAAAPSTVRTPAPAQPVALATAGEDDPLQQAPRRGVPTDHSVLSEAEKAFAEKRYAEADESFARAFAQDAADPQHAQQWAYCKLFKVIARLKESEAARTPIPAADLEREVTTALRLAAEDAKLGAFARQVMDAVRQRSSGSAAPVTVRHQDRGSDGWARAESQNFRLMHNQPRDFAEQVVRAAEAARAAAVEKWAGAKHVDWKPACEVFLYPTAAAYAKATGKPADSPGHATYKSQNGAVIGRRLDLRADDPNLLACVVPHETTHLVLGDLFADAPLPRWADEGMAVLAEPPARLDRFARTLHSSRRQGRLVPLDKLFGKDEYPDAALITVFYVESVSVVEFLVAEKGPQVFVQFVRDVTKSGLQNALQKHYDCQSVATLQDRWLVKTFPAADVRTAGGQGGQ